MVGLTSGCCAFSCGKLIAYRLMGKGWPLVFSVLVVSYLFLGGAGAGALVVLSLLECVNARRRFGRTRGRSRLGRTYIGRAMGPLRVEGSGVPGGMRYYEGGRLTADAAGRGLNHGSGEANLSVRIVRAFVFPGEFFARAWPVCFVSMACGVLCLAADLGHPERILGFVIHPEFSAMTLGAYALAVSLVCAGAFAALALSDVAIPDVRVVYALSVVGIASGLVAVAYTGVLLSGLASVLFWQTWLLPALFSLSSLSCGVALVFLAAAFVEVRQSFAWQLRNLARVDSMLIVLEALCLAALLAWGLRQEGTLAAAQALVMGELAWLFWGGLVGLGLALPLAMEQFVAHGNYSSQLLWVAAAVLLGGFILRFCIVGAGAYDVTQAMGIMAALQ